MPKVGYVWIGECDADVSGAGLRQGLVDKGYEIGRNLALEERYAQGDIEKIPALIAELLALKVDVLVTVGTLARIIRTSSCEAARCEIAGFSFPDHATFARLINWVCSGGTGKPAVAYESRAESCPSGFFYFEASATNGA
jgi:hypothetical protein